MKFETKVAPTKSDICGGFGASGSIRPSDWADELFRGEIPGPWLCCYMIRRFGWPNVGSDDYKELCRWTLTTPMPGLYLGVAPYLGGSNLHFAVRFNKEVAAKINRDPGRTAFWDRREAAIIKWWETKGIKLYAWGYGLKQGDSDELVHHFCDCPKDQTKVFGLWRRTKSMTRRGEIPKQANMAEWWLGELIKKNHPEVKLPKMTKRERESRVSRFDLKVKSAIKAALSDLLRPTNVRDISFTPFGDIERTPEAVKRYSNQSDTGYFIGAGYTPEYWYKHATKKERTGQRS
jgi:hypothetical protein